MINFEDIPIIYIKKLLSENEKLKTCIIYEMLNYFIIERDKKVLKKVIYKELSIKYNLSPSAIRQIFFKKLTKIIKPPLN